MPKFGYSTRVEGPCGKAFGREMRISPKHAMEVCRAIRNMRLDAAKRYLEDVQKKKKAVPFMRHRKKLAHRKGVGGSGQYPVKAAREILKVLKNAEANAGYKGLDTEKLRIVHASAYKGITVPGILPRAFGRATPHNKPLTNVEIILKEVP
ncbi:MAG: 50S ribosomal protein L22 [Hadesarchaea archaeon]|nr:MAG: 50S ribosomal protein L22 [Hadesarchaea archaeon]HDI12849.1 50S ribosomal protein L22 [Hadesarchaea archaeon]